MEQLPTTHKDVGRYAYKDVGGRLRLEQADEGNAWSNCRDAIRRKLQVAAGRRGY
jgi:hypothetical protein